MKYAIKCNIVRKNEIYCETSKNKKWYIYPTALERLTLLCVLQCKEHLSILKTFWSIVCRLWIRQRTKIDNLSFSRRRTEFRLKQFHLVQERDHGFPVSTLNIADFYAHSTKSSAKSTTYTKRYWEGTNRNLFPGCEWNKCHISRLSQTTMKVSKFVILPEIWKGVIHG